MSDESNQRTDTVTFVQEWMMSGDHEPDQWHRDFAAAIDARCTPSVPESAKGERVVLTNGSLVTDDHRDIIENGPRAGQQKAYVVLSMAERAKGFVRPVRRSYVHKACGVVTTMGQSLAETYARDPAFYSGTFCCGCGTHFPVGETGEFVWNGTDEKVGS